jgi:hypothetical protein
METLNALEVQTVDIVILIPIFQSVKVANRMERNTFRQFVLVRDGNVDLRSVTSLVELIPCVRAKCLINLVMTEKSVTITVNVLPPLFVEMVL